MQSGGGFEKQSTVRKEQPIIQRKRTSPPALIKLSISSKLKK